MLRDSNIYFSFLFFFSKIPRGKKKVCYMFYIVTHSMMMSIVESKDKQKIMLVEHDKVKGVI